MLYLFQDGQQNLKEEAREEQADRPDSPRDNTPQRPDATLLILRAGTTVASGVPPSSSIRDTASLSMRRSDGCLRGVGTTTGTVGVLALSLEGLRTIFMVISFPGAHQPALVAAPARITPASAAEQEEHDNDNQDSFHFLYLTLLEEV